MIMNTSPGNHTSQNQISVLILDHHTLVRQGFRMLVESRLGVKVVGEAGSVSEALALSQQLNPDIILLELNLDGNLDLEIITKLSKAASKAKIILVTGISESQIRHQAVQLGAMGVVRKEDSSEVLRKAIEKVHAGEVWIDRTMMADVLVKLWRSRDGEPEDPEAMRIVMLSGREKEVIRLVGEGLKNKEIADRLSISEVTVRHHLTSVYNKLEVNDRLELTIFAYRNGLAELPL